MKAVRRATHERNRERKVSENILRYGKSLTRRQFDAYCYCRMPLVRFTAEEIEWYSLFENRLLGIVLRDVNDDDYGFIILGRDKRKLFRCIDVGTEFYASPAEARKSLARKLSNDYLGKVQDGNKRCQSLHSVLPSDRRSRPRNQWTKLLPALLIEERQ